MADHRSDEPERRQDLSYLSTSELRDVANAHLFEIAAEEEEERQSDIARQRDLLQYAKRPSKTRTEAKQEQAPKAPKLRSAQNVLDRLRWDPVHKQSSYLVGYLERFEGIKEMPLDKWTREETHEEWIPQHRIKYFKEVQTGEIVWHRDERIDVIFGSGLGSGGGVGSHTG